jgi:hypothetical protein
LPKRAVLHMVHVWIMVLSSRQQVEAIVEQAEQIGAGVVIVGRRVEKAR